MPTSSSAICRTPSRADRERSPASSRDLAEPFGLDAAVAAFGVREVVNSNMARAIRAVTVERGVDPRDFTLVAIGGSGPVHAVDIARRLSMPRVLVPASPGVFTAMGMLAGDLEHYLIRPLPGRLDGIDFAGARRIADELAAEVRERLLREGVADEDISLQPEIDMRFRGQEMSLAVPLSGTENAPSLRDAFLAAYGAIYSYASDDVIETVSLRLIGRGLRPGKLDFRHEQAALAAPAAPMERREVYFGPERGWIDTPVHDRATLRGRVEGPAILQGADSTVLVPPDAAADTDAFGNLLITLAEGRL